MTPGPIRTLLLVPITLVLARLLLTLPFWASGLAKLVDFSGGVAEMQQFGFNPPVAFNVAVIVTQLVGSLLVILNRWTWLGAGALGVFTGLCIILVHHFWNMEGEPGMYAMFFAMEHVGLIGGLILVSILSVQPRRTSRYA